MTPAQERQEAVSTFRGILIGAGPVLGGLLLWIAFTAPVWGAVVVGWLE